jgi:ribonuclease III
MSPDDLQRIETLGGLLEFTFERPDLALSALTHPSYSHVTPGSGADYQRLEFLGDAVLDMVVADTLYHQLGAEEGQMTQARAAVVNTRALAAAAQAMGIDELLRVSPGARQSGDHRRPKVLADVFEAVLGALYLERGLAAASAFVETHLATVLADALAGRATTDPKSALSEVCQQTDGTPPEYRLVDRSGPDHAPHHRVAAFWGKKEPAYGEGVGVKAAQVAAAQAALGQWFGAGEEQ